MKLFLAQHGDALPEQIDPARPLSERGRKDVERVAEFVGGGGVRLRHVYHSGKLRARQTAEILAARIGSPNAVVESTTGIDPNDRVEPAANWINAATEDIFVVGHLPFMGRLVAHLLGAPIGRQTVAFEPGSIVCMERHTGGSWSVAWMLRPALFKDRADQSDSARHG